MMTAATVDNAIDALGGNTAVGRMLDVVPSAVSNWRRLGYFPPRLSIELRRHAGARGVVIPDALFRAVPNRDRERVGA